MIKNRFLAGLTIIIPIVITIFVIVWLLREINRLFNPFSVLIYHLFHIYIPDIGLALLIILIFIAGFFVTNVLGKKIVDFFENVILKIPLVSLLYKSTKQWVDIFSPEKASFKKFVLVKYQGDKFLYGFLTSNTRLTGSNGETSDYSVVYIPTNHLYIGINIIVKKEDIIETGLPVDQGMQVVLSAGISFPGTLKVH